jgi:hypothetical protein
MSAAPPSASGFRSTDELASEGLGPTASRWPLYPQARLRHVPGDPHGELIWIHSATFEARVGLKHERQPSRALVLWSETSQRWLVFPPLSRHTRPTDEFNTHRVDSANVGEEALQVSPIQCTQTVCDVWWQSLFGSRPQLQPYARVLYDEIFSALRRLSHANTNSLDFCQRYRTNSLSLLPLQCSTVAQKPHSETEDEVANKLDSSRPPRAPTFSENSP